MKYFLLHHQYPDELSSLHHQGPYEWVNGGDVEFTPKLFDYYYSGQPVDLYNQAVRVELHKSVKRLHVDFFHTMSGAFFASEGLMILLKSYQNDLQIIPADVCYGHGKCKSAEKKYFLIHADYKLPCFDYQKSEYAGKAMHLKNLDDGRRPDSFLVKGVTSVAIDEKIAENNNYFFLKNVLVLDPIVSEPLATAMQERKLNVRLEPLFNA